MIVLQKEDWLEGLCLECTGYMEFTDVVTSRDLCIRRERCNVCKYHVLGGVLYLLPAVARPPRGNIKSCNFDTLLVLLHAFLSLPCQNYSLVN